MAPGIRKVRKPTSSHVIDTGPLPKKPGTLLMNRTMATKIATMSNEFSTFGSTPPATRSEVSSDPVRGSAAAVTDLLLSETSAPPSYSPAVAGVVPMAGAAPWLPPAPPLLIQPPRANSHQPHDHRHDTNN